MPLSAGALSGVGSNLSNRWTMMDTMCEETGDNLPYPEVPARSSCGAETEVQVGVRSRSRKHWYKASEVVVFMLMRASEPGTKGRLGPDSLCKKHISTCSRDLPMFKKAGLITTRQEGWELETSWRLYREMHYLWFTTKIILFFSLQDWMRVSSISMQTRTQSL